MNTTAEQRPEAPVADQQDPPAPKPDLRAEEPLELDPDQDCEETTEVTMTISEDQAGLVLAALETKLEVLKKEAADLAARLDALKKETDELEDVAESLRSVVD